MHLGSATSGFSFTSFQRHIPPVSTFQETVMGDNILNRLNKLIIWTLIIGGLLAVIGVVIWKQMT